MKAIMTGSFDPITLGHIEIAKKALKIFDELHVVALLNQEKNYMFSLEEKRELMRLSLKDLDNIIIDTYDGMTADYMHKHGITKIIRGIRGEKDIPYEIGLAKTMKTFDQNFETIFINCDRRYENISSTLARELILNQKSLVGVISPYAIDKIYEIIKNPSD